jgi:hypothetical protein
MSDGDGLSDHERAERAALMELEEKQDSEPEVSVSDRTRLRAIYYSIRDMGAQEFWCCTKSQDEVLQKSRARLWQAFREMGTLERFPEQLVRQMMDEGEWTLPVFAFDPARPNRPGAREYLTCSYQKFYRNYMLMSPDLRFYYELIVADQPCHFYVDAEFHHATNDASRRDLAWSPARLNTVLLQELGELCEQLGIIKDARKEMTVITLNSSTAKKVSFHFVVKFCDGQTVFKNNAHCGALRRQLEHRILMRYGPMQGNPFFFWNQKEQEFVFKPERMNKEFYWDGTVYSRFRIFRLLGSAKRSAPAPKPYLRREDYDANAPVDKLPPSAFYECLIQRVSPVACTVELRELDGSRPEDGGGNTLHSRRMRTLTPGQQMEEYNGSGGQLTRLNLAAIEQQGGGVRERRMPTTDTKDQQQQLTKLNTFLPETNNSTTTTTTITIESLARLIKRDIETKFPAAGKLDGKPVYAQAFQTLTAESDSQTCAIAGRTHTGNHIYFVVHLRDCTYVQRCFSQHGCSNRETEPRKLSPEIETQVRAYLLQQEDQHIQRPEALLEIFSFINQALMLN